jgi:type IV pilus assembly protein PilQ
MRKIKETKVIRYQVLGMLLGLSMVVGCGSKDAPTTVSDSDAVQESVSFDGPNQLQDISVDSQPLGTIVTFTGTQPMSPNIFKLEEPSRIVVDLTDTQMGDVTNNIAVGDSTVQTISMEQFDDAQGSLSRAEIALNVPSEYQMESFGNQLILRIGDVEVPAAASEQPLESIGLFPEDGSDAPDLNNFEDDGQLFPLEGDAATDPFALTTDDAFVAPADEVALVTDAPASAITDVDYATSEEGTIIMISGNGQVGTVNEQALGEPNRLVFDFVNVLQADLPEKNMMVGTQEVDQIRVGENPEYTRVVLDLKTDTIPEYTLSRTNDKVTILIQRPLGLVDNATIDALESAPVVSEASPNTTMVDDSTVNVDFGLGLDVENRRKIVIDKVNFEQMEGIQKSRITIGLNRADTKFDVLIPREDQVKIYIPNARFKNELLERYLDTSEYASSVSRVTPSYDADDKASSFLISTYQTNVPYEISQDGQNLYIDFPMVDKPQEAQAAASNTGTSVDQPLVPAQEVSMSEAMAPEAKETSSFRYKYVDESFMSDSVDTGTPLSQMGRILAGDLDGRRFTGRKISLDIKDADVRSIFRLIADISKFNLIISDDVNGRVTIKLDDVPWDQAFAIILQSKGLWFEKYGNIVRIAPSAKLQEEKEAAAAAERAAQAVKPLDILFKPVSYAEAGTLTSQVGTVLSERGSVDIDSRTNTLIIKDIRENLEKAKKMIDILDTQTPQVSIEARIVEATTRFGRSLGITWTGQSRFTPQTGNPTGLYFPNSIEVPFALDFTGSLTTATQSAGINMGSINNVLDLDLQLAFGEQRGESKLISSPKVTVLDNKSATISSGRRIPFITQTADSGSNVRFENAATSLNVTPHITNEGAVLMNITATRNEPSGEVVLDNPIITQRTATTEVLVKSGNTTVLGGIYAMSTGRTIDRVPFLSSIPILGFLFKSNDKTLQRDELLIFITPRIVGDEREAIRDVRQ